MATIKLQTQPAPVRKPEPLPEGMAPGWRESKFEGQQGYEITCYPELGTPRVYPMRQIEEGIVVPVGNRRFRVTFDPRNDWGDCPEGGAVTFEETSDPETPFSTEEGYQSVIFFGQPCFIQHEVFPQVDGKGAALLFRIESEWGDAGNEHVFCSFNAEGLPIAVWHEASCC